MAHASLPLQYWPYAFETTVYLINGLPTPLLNNISHFQILFHQEPDYKFLKIFGCAVFSLLKPYNSHKFSLRSTQCVFLGYSPLHVGYRCLDYKTKRMYIARHAHFIEHIFTFAALCSHPSKIPLPSHPLINDLYS